MHFMVTLPIHQLFLDDELLNVTKNVTENVAKNVTKKAADRQQKIKELVADNPYITIAQLARLCDVSLMTINRDIEDLSEHVIHIGPKKGGHWEIINPI